MKKIKLIAVIMITLLLPCIHLNAQVSTPLNNSTIPADYAGWDNLTFFPLNIKHEGNHGINFFTNNTFRVTFDSLGNVGIAIAKPQFKLDVDSGAINIHMYKKFGYYIGGYEVLKIHGLLGNADTTNISVGVNAGRNIISGKENTMVGNQAGFSDSIESEETFVGYKAGYSTHSGPGNTMVGSTAGYSNTYGRGNVFEGVAAGYNNTGIYLDSSVACYNTFVGNYCGFNNILGNANSFYGKHAGAQNVNGNYNVEVGNHSGEQSTTQYYNTFLGYRSGIYNKGNNNVMSGYFVGAHNGGNNNCFYGGNAGYHNKGSKNTYIGDNASPDSAAFNNSTSLGANTIVNHSNNMILGDNNVWAGIGLSNDNTGPRNSLEINARDSIFGDTIINKSGLKFRQLTANNTPQANQGKMGVLALDLQGNVIYVPGNGNNPLAADNGVCTHINDTCTSTLHVELGGWLQKNTQIKLYDTVCHKGGSYNLYYAGQADTNNIRDYIKRNVAIGIPITHDTLRAKLDVLQQSGIVGVLRPYFNNENSIGINILNTFHYPTDVFGECIGIKSHVIGNNPTNIAGKFISENAKTKNYAGYFSADSAAPTNYGIYASASKSNTTYAGNFIATGINGNFGLPTNTYGGYFVANGGNRFAISYGIKTVANQTPPPPHTSTGVMNYGIWAEGNSPGYAGWFQGNVNIVGTATCTSGTWTPSDSILKQNKANITNALGILSQLKPRTYNYDTINYSFMNLPSGRQFGLYAEETDSIVPELVKGFTFPEQLDSVGKVISPEVDYKGLNYTGLIPIAIQAIKDLDSAVTVLENTTPPNKPILVYPVNKTDSIPLQVTLTWEKSARATSYTVYINQPLSNIALANVAGASSTVITNDLNLDGTGNNVKPMASSIIINVTDTFAVASLPSYYSNYSWYVVANNNAGSSNMSDQWNFTTVMPPIPAAPVLVMPFDSAIGLPLANTFTWNKSAVASNYTLFISTDSTYNNLVNKINVSDTFANATVPNYNTTYYWWILASNVSGQSLESDIWNFGTTIQSNSSPAAPQLASPINGDTVIRKPVGLSFNWYKSTGASYYTFYLSTTSDKSGIIYNNMVSDTFTNVQLPYGDTTYYWAVNACNIYSCSDISEIWHFVAKTQSSASLTAPQLASPVDGDTVALSSSMVIPLNWYKSATANYYTVYISTSLDSTGIIYNTMVTDTFNYFKLPYYDTTYYWCVVAHNQNSHKRSDIWHFIVKPVVTNNTNQITEATLSDSTLFKSKQSLSNNAMSLISQMHPVEFYWDTINNTWLPSTQQIGLIGQDMKNIVPQVVFKDTKGYSNIQYGRLTALLVEGMKEISNYKDTLNGRIDSLKNVVVKQKGSIDSLKNVDVAQNVRFDSVITAMDSLEAMLNRCCANKNARTIQSGSSNENNNDNNSNGNVNGSSEQSETPNIHNIELANNAILYQNAPNPFGNGTIIKYFVPDYTDAQIVFYDEFGNQLKKYNIEEKGMGQLNVDASNLSSGMYSYSLVVNGKVIDSKKMICSK